MKKIAVGLVLAVAAGLLGGTSGAGAGAQVSLSYTFSPPSGPVGSTIHVTGTGCAPGAGSVDISFTLNNGPGRSDFYETNPDGSFSFDYVIPPARAGEQEPDNTYATSAFCLSTEQGIDGASFTITGPEYGFTPPSAAAGATVQVSGLGCVNDENAEQDGTFSFAGGDPVAFRSGDDDRFSFAVTVPNVAPGTYDTEIVCLSQQLESPSGTGGVQLRGTARFTVLSSEFTANELFVIAVYAQVLGRDVDDGGLAFWAGELDDGLVRTQFANAILSSGEGRGVACNDLYGVWLDRSTDASGAAFCASLLAGGQRYVDVAIFLAASPEYLARNGGSNSGFLDGVYRDGLGRTIDAGGRVFWLGRFAAGDSRDSVARAILVSAEGFGRVVDGVYDAAFDRTPDDGGRAFWVGQLQGGMSEANFVAQILGSDEFFARASAGETSAASVVEAAVIGD